MRKPLMLLLIATLAVSCSQTPEEKLESLSATAVEQIDDYRFVEALGTIDEIGKIHPGSPLIFYYHGLIHERRLCFQDALHDYMVAGTVDPEFGPGLAGLYRCYSRLGESAGAVRAAAEYARVNPSDREAAIMLARARIEMGQYRGAAVEIDRASELEASEAVTSLMMARTWFLSNEFDSARAACERALNDPENTIEFLTAAAELHETMGLIDSSMQFSRKLIEVAPDNHDLLLDHFFRCLRVRYYYDARQTIVRIPEKDGGEVARSGLWVHYYRSAGERSRAREATQRFRGLTDNAFQAVSLDIAVRAAGGDLASAGADLNTMQTMLERGDFLAEYRAYMVYSLQIDFPESVSNAENLDVLKKLPTEYGNRREVKQRIAFLMHKVGDFDGYKEFVSILEDYHRSQPDWLTTIADVNAKQIIRKYEQAERLYTRALELNSWYRPAFEHQVVMYRNTQRYADALDLFDRYPHFSERYPALSLLEAQVLAENERFDPAQASFSASTAHLSGDITAMAEYLDILGRHGQNDFIDSTVEIVRTNRYNPDATLLAAIWECKRLRFEDGLELAEHSLSIEPDNADYHAVKARALHGLGRKSEAYELFEENYARDRNNILNNLYHSHLLAAEGIDLSRAENIAREVNTDALGDLDVWMNLCYVYYQSGRYDLSRGEASKAVRSFPHRPEPYYRLGMAMYQEGKPEARENLQKAIALGLIGEDLETANETLANL